MSFGNKILLTLLAIVLTVSLVGIFWLSGLPATSAQYTLGTQPLPVRSAPRAADERLTAVFSCFPPELTINNQDRRDRFARAWTEMKNDQLERTLALSDNPKLNEAEIKFEECLQAKGITPQRQLLNLIAD